MQRAPRSASQQLGGYQLLKMGLAGSLDAPVHKGFRLGSSKMLERVFGTDRVDFYKAIMDSVRDFKTSTRRTDKRSEVIKNIRTSKEELATLAKNIRDQLASIAPEKLSKMMQGVTDKDKKVRGINDLLRRLNTVTDDMIRKKNSAGMDFDDDRGMRMRSSPFPSELNKYMQKDMTTVAELEARVREDLAAVESEQADTTSTASAISAIAATQSFLADAGQLVIRSKAMAKMTDIRPEDELLRDEVVITTTATTLDAEFFVMLFGKVKALTQKMDPFNPINNTISPTFPTTDTNVMIKGIERYRAAVENILRYLNNTARESDEAIRALEKETKGTQGSIKVPSVRDVRAIYNAHMYERKQRSERVSEVAIELRNLVRKMESARRDNGAPDITDDLRKRKQSEFDYECLRIQKKIDKELDHYPEMREMYLQICKKKVYLT